MSSINNQFVIPSPLPNEVNLPRSLYEVGMMGGKRGSNRGSKCKGKSSSKKGGCWEGGRRHRNKKTSKKGGCCGVGGRGRGRGHKKTRKNT